MNARAAQPRLWNAEGMPGASATATATMMVPPRHAPRGLPQASFSSSSAMAWLLTAFCLIHGNAMVRFS